MEVVLREIRASSMSLLDFRDMYEVENRLKTFTEWPFKESCKCSPENVSLKLTCFNKQHNRRHLAQAQVNVSALFKIGLFPIKAGCLNQ